jgi:hypothetical protein
VAALSDVVHATPSGAPSPATAPCTCAPDPTARLHDGFFARADAGLSGFVAGVSGSASGRTRIYGIGQSGSIWIGGTPLPGLVVGGSLWTALIDPSFVEKGALISPDDDSVKLTLGRLGPFFDWYPNPRRGFHVQATIGLSVQVESDTKGHPIKPPGVGGAGAFALGYEWFLGNQFSMGLAARVAFGAVARSPSTGEERTFFEIPELAVTSTFH